MPWTKIFLPQQEQPLIGKTDTILQTFRSTIDQLDQHATACHTEQINLGEQIERLTMERDDVAQEAHKAAQIATRLSKLLE